MSDIQKSDAEQDDTRDPIGASAYDEIRRQNYINDSLIRACRRYDYSGGMRAEGQTKKSFMVQVLFVRLHDYAAMLQPEPRKKLIEDTLRLISDLRDLCILDHPQIAPKILYFLQRTADNAVDKVERDVLQRTYDNCLEHMRRKRSGDADLTSTRGPRVIAAKPTLITDTPAPLPVHPIAGLSSREATRPVWREPFFPPPPGHSAEIVQLSSRRSPTPKPH